MTTDDDDAVLRSIGLDPVEVGRRMSAVAGEALKRHPMAIVYEKPDLTMKPGDVIWLHPWAPPEGPDDGRLDRHVVVWTPVRYGKPFVRHFCVCPDGGGWAAIGFDCGWKSKTYPTREEAMAAAETFVVETWGR